MNHSEYFCTAWRSRIASPIPTARPATTHTALGTSDRALYRRGIASRARHVAHRGVSDRHRHRTSMRDRPLGSAADVQPRARPTREQVRLWRERPTDGARTILVSGDLGAISVRSRRRHLLLKRRHLAITAEIVRRSVAVPTARRHKPAHTPLPTQPAWLHYDRPSGADRLSRCSSAFSETRSITRRWLSVSAGDVTSSRRGMTPILFGVSTPRRAPSSPHACAEHVVSRRHRRAAVRRAMRRKGAAVLFAVAGRRSQN